MSVEAKTRPPDSEGTSPNTEGLKRKRALDATAIELATGLSIDDIELLGSDPSADTRASIAVKFANEFDRLAKGPANKLTGDLLNLFSRDHENLVRRRFADSIKSSIYLPPMIATRLARDDIDVAAPILRESPVLEESVLGEIIQTMSEAYALIIADRRPLSGDLVDLMIDCKGTVRVAARLIDNEEADLSEDALLRFREWGQSSPDLAKRLSRRPNLPFAFVKQSVLELADSVRWSSLSEAAMTKFEATQLQKRIEGKSMDRHSTRGGRFLRMQRALRENFERGELQPSMLLAFMRDQNVDRLECGFAVMSGLDVRTVRKLLYDSDRRSLIALCLKANFTAADYLAFRMALSLAELGTMRERSIQRYDEKIMRFARDQFEKMRSDPHALRHWLPPDEA